MDRRDIYQAFKNNGGILRTSELNKLGLYSRQINRLIENGDIVRIKCGFYELTDNTYPEEVAIARLFPKAVIFLQSALTIYGYTDKIPSFWQIAVDRNSEKSQYQIDYPIIDVFYMESKLLDVGIDTMQIEGVDVKIFDRDRTICDILRYENKIGRTKTPFSIDFGMGDIVIPSPVERTLPVLLSEFKKPRIFTYSLESTVAEKIDTIISLIEITGRMKDFYDIYYIAISFDFEGRKLQEAIYETLTNRGRAYERNSITDIFMRFYIKIECIHVPLDQCLGDFSLEGEEISQNKIITQIKIY